VKDSRDLARKVAGMTPGTSVKFSVLRKGETKTVELTLGTLPNRQQAKAETEQSDRSGAAAIPHLGLSLAPAKDVAGSGDKGVVVMGVEPDGPAAEQGFKTGDIILDVGGKAVANVPDLRKALSDATAGGKHDVLIRVKTADGMRFVALPLRNA
jgi:serine protease Do